MDTLVFDDFDFIEILDEESGDVYFCEIEREPEPTVERELLTLDWNLF